MTNNKRVLKFDHKEIAVLFSLFVFVSLLMFTVGILVGKGLTQAKYEGALHNQAENHLAVPGHEGAAETTAEHGGTAEKGHEEGGDARAPASEEESQVAVEDIQLESEKAGRESADVKLVPKKSHAKDLSGSSLQEPKFEAPPEELLKNPKIAALLDESGGGRTHGKRQPASTGPVPASFSSGNFKVQVGSYPTQEDAEQRVSALKKLGFPHAYFSVKELGDKKEKWFRVWLGYFSSLNAAEKSGRLLQEKGEVKNYLVRKADASD